MRGEISKEVSMRVMIVVVPWDEDCVPAEKTVPFVAWQKK